MKLPRQVNIGRRFMWWFPWATTHWYRLWIWTGANEWCHRSVCLDVPLAGTFIVFWERRLRTVPCPECWAELPGWARADYLPGGYLEGGVVHPERESRVP